VGIEVRLDFLVRVLLGKADKVPFLG